jgi:hypothetical protein
MSLLRPVPDDETDPLSLAELKWHGDHLLRDATDAAGEALMASVQPEFLFKRPKYTLRDVQRIRAMAQSAARAWDKVDATLSELLNEVDKSKGGRRDRG